VTIGNNAGAHTDGTFLTNCNNYQDGVSEIRTYVQKTPDPEMCSQSPEASKYQLVSTVSIPKNNGNWDRASQIPYTVNNAVPSDIQRVAYCMQIGHKWVWSSFDYSDRSKLGVPANYKLDGNVQNMNVYSNVVKTEVGVTGKAEFWDNCYNTGGGNSRAYDHDDTPTNSDCYGSMQIHSGKNTIFGFNGWSHGSHCDVTIGNNAGAHTDGTFLTNCNNYQDGVSEIRTYVEMTPVDCVGAHGTFSTCSKSCGGGSKTRTFELSSAAQHGGAACSHAHGHIETEECNTNECPEVVDVEMTISETKESFTEDKKTALKDEIAKALGLSSDEVTITVGAKVNKVSRRLIGATTTGLLITVTINVLPSKVTEEVDKIASPTFATNVATATGITPTFKAFKPAHGSSICATCVWDGSKIQVVHYINAQKHGEKGLQHKCYHEAGKCKCECQ